MRNYNTKIFVACIGLLFAISNVYGQFTHSQIQKLEAEKLEKAKVLLENTFTPKNYFPEQDCINALPICQNSITQTFSYVGSGNVPNEINPGISCLQSGEVNNVWYVFTATATGTLNFTLSPINPADDYDWAIFNLTNNSCEEIYINPTLQVACNFSAIPGNTGANNDTIFNQNEAEILVTAGQTFVINISNFSATQSGYTIDFTASSFDITDITPPSIDSTNFVCKNYGVRIYFNEWISCSSIAADGSDFTASDSLGNSISVIGAIGGTCNGLSGYTNYIDVMLNGVETGKTVTIGIQQGSDGNSIADKCMNEYSGPSVSQLIGKQPILNLGDNLKLCPVTGFIPLLTAQFEDATYAWYKNGIKLSDTTAYYQPTSAGIYMATASKNISIEPCFVSDTLLIEMSMDYCIDNLPNAFSPNDDGYNDRFLEGVEMAIVTRWGQTIYTGSDGWDGMANGSKASNGTYYAIVKFYNSMGELITMKFPVTLIR